MGSLNFTIQGDFITKIAREWIWQDSKPWEKAEELLLACMTGTDSDEATLKRYASDIICGRKKLVGDSTQGVSLEDDDKDFVKENLNPIRRKLQKAEEEAKDTNQRLLQLEDYLCDHDLEYLVDRAFSGDEEDEEELPSYQPPAVSGMVKSFIDQVKIEEKHDNNYGWLAPDGTFYPVPWGNHEKWAVEYMKEHHPLDLEDPFFVRIAEEGRCECWDNGNILREYLHFVLLHNPWHGMATVTKSEQFPLTKQQKDFLYGYYIDRGQTTEAEKYMED